MLNSTFDNEQSYPKADGITLHPPAKLNLSLVVFDSRDDGFHGLHTVMAMIDLCDDLNIKVSDTEGLRLKCTGIESPPGPDNLVIRAAKLLSEHANVPMALDISLHKRIPTGGGLGGASSDAAACLIGLNHLWQLNLSLETLSELAAQLGSDIPFFLQGPVAICTGRGEIIQKLPHRPSQSILLITPGIHASTADVYKNYTYDTDCCDDYMRRIQYYLRLGDLNNLASQGLNTLTNVTMELFAPLKIIREKIEQLGIAPVNMSGSGSSLFVTSDSNEQLAHWEQLILQHNLAQAQVVGFLDHAQFSMEAQHADF